MRPRNFGGVSCVLAVLAILLWPFFNTIASPIIALAAVGAGVASVIAARRASPCESVWPSLIGTAIGGLVFLFWCGVMVIVLSGIAGHPF